MRISTLRNENETFSQLNSITYIGVFLRLVTYSHLPYVDRFGNEHYTIEGLRWLAQQAIAQYGWILIDSFQDGANITLPNQALRDEDTGEYYRWDGALPKHVDAGSTPSSSGGVGVGAWVGIGDASLRAMLATSAGAGMIGALDSDGNATTVQNAIGHYRAYTVKKRLDEELSVGAIAGVDPTGATDSTAALNGFFSLLNTNGTRTTIRIPAGTYLTTGLTINNTSLVIKGAGEYPYGASTTKIKAAAANTTLMTFTRSGCRIEGLLLEGFEAAVNSGATETCIGLKFQLSSGGADIDSFVTNNTFFCLKNAVIGYGRNLTLRENLFSHVAFPITLNYVSGQQFRGHVIDENRFHSCGGLGASTDASLAGSVCIKLVVNTAAGTLADNYAGNISIRNNKCDGGCYQFFSGSLHRGSIFSNNDMFRCGGAGATVVKIDNTQTASNTDYEAVVFSGNVLASDIPVSTPQAFPDYALWMTGIRGAVLSGNEFSKAGKHGIVIDNCADLIISSTQLKNPNMNVAVNGATFNAVEITNGGNNIQILGLNVRCTQANPQIQYVVNNASAQNVMVENVQAGNYTGMYNEGASARTHGTLNFGANRRKEVFATATSTLTSGNYAVGDICWLTAPAATGTSYIGAVCVTAGIGSAAVWRSFGALV
ncbi:glycosyl hydrolase family 28-related protein [Enterobacter cloacae]|uniref:tail fiber/spike domain-containing protein n=1 Tax=Enterobacter cloacae TaxID=550 RepID=UPI003F445255